MNYPKEKDISFKKKTVNGIIECQKPFYDKRIANFSDNAKNVKENSKQRFIINYAEEGLRESYQLSKLKELGQFQHSAFLKKRKV